MVIRATFTILTCSLRACLPEDAHMDESMFNCFSSHRRFYRFSRNELPCWKSARLRGGVMLQLLSAPLPDGIGFLQRSVATHPINLPCGRPSSEEAGCCVYHVLLVQLW